MEDTDVEVISNLKRIKLLTLNIKGLPKIYDHTSRERAEELVPIILGSGVDVICLQEVFDSGVREILVEGLSDMYPNILTNFRQKYPPNFLGNSGLLIAVAKEFSVDWHQFIPFENISGPDALSWKGILGTKITYKQDNSINFIVFTTHLCSNSKTLLTKKTVNNTRNREKETELIHNFISAQNHDNIVLCGDFNFDDKSISYFNLEYSGYTDVYRKFNPSQGYTIDYRNNHSMVTWKSRTRIDYTFIFNKQTDPFSIEEPVVSLNAISSHLFYPGQVPNDLLSDHFGIISEFEVSTPRYSKHVTFKPKKQISFWKRVLFPFCCYGVL